VSPFWAGGDVWSAADRSWSIRAGYWNRLEPKHPPHPFNASLVCPKTNVLLSN